MTSEDKEWYTLVPENTSHIEHTRPESVVSDICTEDNTTAPFLQQNLSSIDQHNCSDISDVLSPDRKGNSYQFRIPPAGIHSGRLNNKYFGHRVTQQEVLSLKSSPCKNTEESFTQNFLEEVAHNLSSDALQKALADLSQHELEPSLVQHPIENINENTSDSNILRNMSDKTELSQNPLGISSSVNESDNNSKSLGANQVSDLSQYPFSDPDVTKQRGSLSQHPLEISGNTFDKSCGDTDNMFMLSSKDSRPGTIIERPLTEGENEKDKQSFVITHVSQDSNSHFDNSIKYGHGHHQESIGDTLLYSDKQPVGSSTPFSDRPSETSEFTKQLESLPKHEMFKIHEGGSETDSDSNISKFMKKAGIDTYVPVDQRESLMCELLAAQHQNSDNSSSVKEIDSEKGRSSSNRSPSQRSATSSPGRFHELIPDTPSFRGDTFPRQGSPSQRSVGSQRSRTSQIEDLSHPSLEHYTIEESAVQKTRRSGSADTGAADHGKHSISNNHSENSSSCQKSECSSLGSLPHTRPNVDTHRRNSGSSSDARDEPPQYKSSDTLLGYDGRDALSLGSSGSHPHTPRSDGSNKDIGESGEEKNTARPANFKQLHSKSMKSDSEDETSVKSDKSSASQKSQGSRHSYTSNVGSVISVSSLRSQSAKHGDEDHHDITNLTGKCSFSTSGNTTSSTLGKQTQLLGDNLLSQSVRSPTEGQETVGLSDQGSLSSVRIKQSPPNNSDSSYRDERWANKVTDVLDSVTRRQNLSQRVASILATAPTTTPRTATNSEKSTPVSRRSSQGQDKTRTSTSTLKQEEPNLLSTDEQLHQEAATVASLVKMAMDTAPSSEDEEARRLSTQSSQLTLRSGATSEDEDVARITGEYKAILKGVTQTVEIGGDIGALKAQLISKEKITPQNFNQYDDNVESDEALDKDVKRILAKYGKTLKSSNDENDAESEIVQGRHSPAGSAYDTDDTLSHRVQKLLTKPTNEVTSYNHKLGLNYGNELELTGKSVDSLQPSGLGSLQHRIDEVKQSGEPINKPCLNPTLSVSDTVNDRVRNILAEDDEEDATSKQVSSIGTRSQSRTSSIDYMNLERDLDEIQSNLESLKGDIGGNGHDSDVSEQSAELLKYIKQTASDETLQKTRAALEDDDLDTTSSLTGRRLDPEGHGKSPPPSTGTQLPISPLLTSGVIPMDLALDMIHGDTVSKYTRYPSPGGQSGYSGRSIDTDILLRNAGYTDSTPHSRDDSIQAQWKHSKGLGDRDTSNMDSLTDREVMEINGVQPDEESITERVSKLVDQDSNIKSKDESDIHIEYDQAKDQYAYRTPSGDFQYTTKEGTVPGYSTSDKFDSTSPVLDLSSFSPLTKKPFSAYGTMQSLLTSQRDKVSTTQFDKSIEMSSPYKRQLGGSGSLSVGTISPVNVQDHMIGTEHDRRSPFYGKEKRGASPTDDRIIDSLRLPIGRDSSPHSNKSSPRDGAASRRSSGSLNSMSGLRPYKPPGSREFFYVESGEVDGMSETTVESTHPGSDDAIGPSLPLHVYGSRNEPVKGVSSTAAYNKMAKADSLGTIQEQSLLGDSNISKETEKLSQEIAKPPKTSSRTSAGTPQGSHSSSERERSFTKAQNWVNGNWPSKEDLASLPTDINGDYDRKVPNDVYERQDARSVSANNRQVFDGSKHENIVRNQFRSNARQEKQYASDPALHQTSHVLKEASTQSNYHEASLKTRHSLDGSNLQSNHSQYESTLQSQYPSTETLLHSRYSQNESKIKSRFSKEGDTIQSRYTADRTDEGTKYSHEGMLVQNRQSTLGSKYTSERQLPDSRNDHYISVQGNYSVEPYNTYNEKCQNLQDKYRSLKDKADRAIDQLINESATDDSKNPGYFKPKLNDPSSSMLKVRSEDYSRKEEKSNLRKDFATPKRLGTSRLSLEMSLDDTGRKSLGGKSLNESLRSVHSNSSNGSQDFLKYHSSQAATIVRPSNHRGPEYWSQVIKQNYNEMAKPVVSDSYSYDYDGRTGQMGGSSFGRLSPAGQNDVRLSPNVFTPLIPDMDEDSPLKSRSPIGRAKSPYERTRSPYERTKSPYERTNSPYDRAKSPYERNKSPYDRTKSPYGQSSERTNEKTKSPYERTKSPNEQSKLQLANFPDKYSAHSRLQADRADSPYELARSPHYRSRSPYEISNTQYSHDVYSDPRYSTDLQDMWERFQSIQAENESPQSVKVDLDKLSTLLNNPVRYMVSGKQEGTIFEDNSIRELKKSGSSIRSTKETLRDVYSERHYTDYQHRGSDMIEPHLQINESRSEFSQTNAAQVAQNSRSGSGQGDERNPGDRTNGGPIERKNGGAGGNGDGGDDGDRKKKKPVTESSTTDEERHDETDEEKDEVGKSSEPQKRKMAWVIKDEELLSIPEDSTLDSVSSDFTTSSEIDSDGKIITKTTKRHLPADPKLLKLQQKIAKQKEKYKRELTREKKRKEKILRLEEMLHEQNKAQIAMRNHIKDDMDSSKSTTTTAKNTSTPSSIRHASQDSTLGISDITSSSTLTHATVISDDADYHETTDTLLKAAATGYREDNHKGQDFEDSSICSCCKHGRSKHNSRSASPPKQSSVKRLSHMNHSASPARRNKENVEEPPELRLQAVDYSVNKSLIEKERPSRKSVYLEIEKPKNDIVQKGKRMSVSPSKRKEKENLENMKRKEKDGHEHKVSSTSKVHENKPRRIQKTPEKRTADQKQRSRSGSHKRREAVAHANMASQVTPKAKTRDFGMTCPTPMVLSPPVERTVRTVTMKSEAIQTDRNKQTPMKKDKCLNNTRRVMRKDHSPGMFTPETSGSEDSILSTPGKKKQDLKQVKAQMKKKMVQAAQEGVSWFIPMSEAKPWRKPLKERQANALAMETWPQMNEYTRKKVESITLGYNDSKQIEKNKSIDRDFYPEPKTDLQAAFGKRMDVFISKSRQRQKHIALRSEERKINEIHRSERMKLFHVDKKMEANLEAHPFSDLHYKPKKRSMTKQEMKELTRKKYSKLPEVNQKLAEKKREEANKTNRLRAQMYKKKIQTKVLNKKPYAVLA